MIDLSIKEFLGKLGSAAPVPGGGGAAALGGALCAALCSMVAALTSGKKKYAQYQEDIDRIARETAEITETMENLIEKDAEAFEPLSKAYGIPKEDPNRERILEEALRVACTAPLEILREACRLVLILEELAVKGSRLVLSDVGVSAAACAMALRSAALNVYINTKLMKDRAYAENINMETKRLCGEQVVRCESVYAAVEEALTGGNGE